MSLYELAFWCVAIAAAVVGRFVGWWLGRWSGARHAVAWFGALMGFACTVILLQAQDLGWQMPELRGPVGAGCLIGGIPVALVVETVLTAVMATVRLRRRAPDEKPADEHNPLQFSLRGIFTITLIVSMLLSAYSMTVAPLFKCARTTVRVRASVESLYGHRPKEVPKAQWDNAVGWTQNAVANCLPSPFIKDEQRYYRFADELDKRLQGEVDLATIDWMWDEFIEVSTIGQTYSDKYRPKLK